MKLSAPPPPPPEPGQTPPDANVPAEASPATEPAAPAKPSGLAWPAWFAGADLLLAALAVVLAFMVASFVARNSDLWVHLAAGKRLLSGEYRPGTDPFSYSGSDRPWVNHSLLFDVGAYLLYKGDGTLLVVVKALTVALTFGLLIGLRRPSYALWPWAAVAIVAILAAAPRMTLSPLIGSMLLLALTLFLLFRTSHRPNSWRFPIAIGVVFWIWANIDTWFFIGPLTLALVLVGGLIQNRGWKKSNDTDPEDEPLGRLPDMPTLAKALGIGIVACMLNPHHFRIWELPFELVGAEGVQVDQRLKQVLSSPLSSDYAKDDQRGRVQGGYNLNGLAFAVLFVGGGVVLGLGAGRLRFAHLALWIGFALLSLASIYAIPLLAIVAVPIIASQLNGLSERVTLKSWGDPKSRFLLFGSAGGRVVCVIATLVAGVLAWPGWLHPYSGDPAFARRVAWGVHSDGAMASAARQLQEWRESGSSKLAPETHGVIASIDMANYCAWFAPLEKVFVNGRYNFHRPELNDYISILKGLALVKQEETPDRQKLEEDLKRLGVEYVVVSGSPGDGFVRIAAQETSLLMWIDSDRWSPWYLNGRTVISGWRSAPGQEKSSFAALRIDPIALAFGKRVERIDAGAVKQPPPVMGWEEEFVRGINISPAGADEAIGWVHYGEVRNLVIGQRQSLLELTLRTVDRVSARGSRLLHRCRRRWRRLPTTRPMSWRQFGFWRRAAPRAIAADPIIPMGTTH